MSIPQILQDSITKFKYYKDRPKVDGHMWGGQGEGKWRGIDFTVKLWYHGGNHLTKQGAIANCSIEMFRGYSFSWHSLWTETGILHSPQGWFLDNKNRKLMRKLFGDWFPNSNMCERTITEQQEAQLLNNGKDFILIPYMQREEVAMLALKHSFNETMEDMGDELKKVEGN